MKFIVRHEIPLSHIKVIRMQRKDMLAKTGLLVVSNPKQIGKILPLVRNHVKNTLYIQLLSALTEPFGNFHTTAFNSWPKYSQTIHGIYTQVND